MDVTLDAILPRSLLRRSGPCEKPPEEYGDGFVLPDHSVKPLQTMHTHPNDAHIKFFADPHIYTWKGVPTTTSVTSLAHRFQREFVAMDAIQSMKTSKRQRWPRLDYAWDAREGLSTWDSTRGAMMVHNGLTLSVLPPHSMAANTTLDNLKQALRHYAKRSMEDDDLEEEDDVEWYSYGRGMTDEEISKRWRDDGTLKSHLGTERHLLAELFFNGLPFRWWEPDMRPLYEFCHKYLIPQGIVGHNTEKEIVFPDANLAGSLDLIVWDERRGVYHIIDHKRTDKLRANLRGYDKMSAPLDHIDDCKGAAYALQTSIYQYILEREYGMKIGDRILLSLHNDVPFATSVPYMKTEVEYIMAARVAEVRAQRATGIVCDVTGAPLVDAVRLGDGTLVMEKQATLMKVPYEIDSEVRAHFDAEVQKHLETVTIGPDVQSWRRMMPMQGIVPFSRL